MASTTLTPGFGFSINSAPQGAAQNDLPAGFLEFLAPLHHAFKNRHSALLEARRNALQASLQGRKPTHPPASPANLEKWRIELPDWCQDQRNQMTGPADDAELVVKMLNSGAPGVMLDLEDSTVNDWEHQELGVENILQALRGTLTYFDKKRNIRAAIQPSKTVIWIRPRGLHLHQAGVLPNEVCSASIFDVARIVFAVKQEELKHPLAFYIPKSESADEALFWRDLFQKLAELRGWRKDYLKCMALVESHPLAYQMEEFLYNLREHILGLNLGRWDYMASLIHFNLDDPRWVLPDRNTIPHDVPFFQNLRALLPEICHKRGALAVGGMTALYPNRDDAELNARALSVLEKDKKNEALCFMDGAWTGHPDQNTIAMNQFPVPNQLSKRPSGTERYPDLRPAPEGVGKRTLTGTRAATRTVIRYRNGVLNGKGASLLDGYMEDLATDRIYRLMISQRMKHWQESPIAEIAESDGGTGQLVPHTPEYITRLFDEELQKLLTDTPRGERGTLETLREARRIAEAMIVHGEFDPI
jgi:malate synthase